MTAEPSARLGRASAGEFSYHIAQTPGPRSGNHHLGGSETGIYPASGGPVFVALAQGKEGSSSR